MIRPIEPTDGPLLVEGFARLSPQSRRSRFLGVKTELSAADVRYLVDVDHHDHEALVALGITDGRAVGTARYIRDARDPQGADVAVTVVDDWQRRGVATALIRALVARAEQENLDHFTAHVAADNLAILRLLQRADADVEVVDQAAGVLVYRVFNFRHRGDERSDRLGETAAPRRRLTRQARAQDGCRSPWAKARSTSSLDFPGHRPARKN